MTTLPALLPRDGYEQLTLYSPGETRPCTTDLSDNTNRWGMSAAARDTLQRVDVDRLTRYPTRYGDELKAALAVRLGVSPDCVVTGHGSDGVLDAAVRAFARPGDRMAFPDPTFVMARALALVNGLTAAPVPLTPEYDAEADALLATGARIIYLCSPNNPTGRSLSRRSVEHVAANAPGLVIIDEAYAEFAASNVLDLARSSDRVLVVRTFSKAHGLAGLRVGYGIGSPQVIAAVERSRGPYAVGVHAELAAVAALSAGSAWMERSVREAIAVRSRLTAALRDMGLAPVPSDANFVFVPLGGAQEVALALADAGIAVRAFTGLPAVSPELRESGGGALRITVAPWDTLQPVLDALGRAVAERRGP